MPMLAEEAMATAKGNKLAKTLLDPALARKVKLGNAAGLVSYAVAAAGAALAVIFNVTV